MQLSASELSDLRRLAAELSEEWSLDEAVEPYRNLLWKGGRSSPELQLDDFSAIPFLDGVSGVAEYQHRARLRARTGDGLVTLTPPGTGAERYFREVLGIGEPRHIVASATAGPMAIAQACLEAPVLDELTEVAKGSGRLVVHPFMGIEAVWRLAEELARRSGVEVCVLAPPPPVMWIANDKALFGEVVRRAAGPEWLVEGQSAFGVDQLADALLLLAERYRSVAIKRLRCASAMGNLVFDAERLRSRGRRRTEEEVEAFLEKTRWDGKEEVLAVAWEETDLSPSTQWWLPPAGVGSPRLDGIYEQILEGKEKIFVGSQPSSLPSSLHERLATAGLRVATVLQQLGYVGRCSFDHLVVGDPQQQPKLRFTECNGRWGGTSTPMNLIDRVFGAEQGGPDRYASTARPFYRAQDFVSPHLVGTGIADLLARVESQAFGQSNPGGRFLFYNLGPLPEHGKLDVIALADDPEDAEWALSTLLPELLGIG